VTWDQYLALSDALPDRPTLRFTFDRGRLEIMVVSVEHERYKMFLGRLIDVLTEELDIPSGAYGQFTHRHPDLATAFEPDQCYYKDNLPAVRGKLTIDLTVEPPPDLIVEVDVSHSSVPRLPLFARLGVPEVWRLANGTMRAYKLGPDAQYAEGAESTGFAPGFPVAEFVRFFPIGIADTDRDMARAFRAWLRQWIADRGLTSH
jgi:Uma2 family endonuclease